MLCPSCGKENPNHAISCLSCGAPLVPGVKRHPTPAEALAASPAPSKGRRIWPVIALIVVFAAIAAGITSYSVHHTTEVARAERYQDLTRQMGDVNQNIGALTGQLADVMKQQPADLGSWSTDQWKDWTRKLTAVLDNYDQQVDRAMELLNTIDRERLSSSDSEANQIHVLEGVYRIRKQESGKLREIGNTLASYDEKKGNFTDIQARVNQLKAEAADLDQKASDQLSTIGINQ